MVADNRPRAGADGPAADDHYWERARRGPAPWIIGAVGLAALGAGQFVPVRHHIEDDLRTRSQAALRAAGLPGVSVAFTGRDGRLSGTVTSPADSDRALAAVRALNGVRVATARLRAATGATSPPSSPPAPPPSSPPPPSAPPSPSATSSPSPAPGTGTVPQRTADTVAVQRALDGLTQIGFRFGGSWPTAPGRAAIERAARILTANPDARVRVEGYTDDVGAWEINKTLSDARAETVRRMLIEDGVSPSRLTVFGWSKENPKVPNTSVANRAINRRVHFRVLP